MKCRSCGTEGTETCSDCYGNPFEDNSMMISADTKRAISMISGVPERDFCILLEEVPTCALFRFYLRHIPSNKVLYGDAPRSEEIKSRIIQRGRFIRNSIQYATDKLKDNYWNS